MSSNDFENDPPRLRAPPPARGLTDAAKSRQISETGRPGPNFGPSSSSPPSAAAGGPSTPQRDQLFAKMGKNEQYHSEAFKLRKLHQTSAALRAGGPHMPNTDAEGLATVNPIWMKFPGKCANSITSEEELRRKLDFHSHTDEVFVMRYHQNNCTACNALERSFEYLCHEARRHYPKLSFYEINKDENPELTKGMVRFPQVKGFSMGQWIDLDFKPPENYRQELLDKVDREVTRLTNQGNPVTALQAQEMYFSAAGPAMLTVLEGNLIQFYAKSQARLHNYFKQISLRRTWFYKRFIEPEVDPDVTDRWNSSSVLGEKVVYGPRKPTMEL